MDTPCKLCDAPTTHFGTQRVLGIHEAEYRRCSRCGYVFVLDPHWLEEAHSIAIAALDTGIVIRNLWLADATCALLGLSLRQVRTVLDYGGGSGLLVRLMRDRGHDFHWYDEYSPNLLAGGFESGLDGKFDMATAFELVEHLPDPLSTFVRLRGLAPVLLISTELLSPDVRQLDDWWYYAPECGQHIGFFTERSLRAVAERLGWVLSSNGRNLHVMSERPVSRVLLDYLRKPSHARRLAWTGIRRTLAWSDGKALLERLRRAQAGQAPAGQDRPAETQARENRE